jgi:hypothetical protein
LSPAIRRWRDDERVSIARLIILSFPLVVAAGLSGQAGWPVVVTSTPSGAVVYLDGALVGLTPVSIDRVTAGSHRLRLTRDGHLEHLKVVAAVAPSEHHVTLTPLPLHSGQAQSPGRQPKATTDGENWFTKRKWLWIGAGAGGAAAALFLTRPSEPVTGGSVLVSPTIGLQAATPVTFASQGAGGGSSGTLTYTWDFGDGTTGSGPLVTHVYGTAGLFTVKLSVSDGKKSATATTATVTIRSLAGTWRGTLAGALGVTMTLTQNGAAVTGVYTDQAASGPLTGSARPASPRVNLVINPSGFPAASYAADPTADVSRLTGIYRQQGLTIDLSLTRD